MKGIHTDLVTDVFGFIDVLIIDLGSKD